MGDSGKLVVDIIQKQMWPINLIHKRFYYHLTDSLFEEKFVFQIWNESYRLNCEVNDVIIIKYLNKLLAALI